jgi:hypothetical protein
MGATLERGESGNILQIPVNVRKLDSTSAFMLRIELVPVENENAVGLDATSEGTEPDIGVHLKEQLEIGVRSVFSLMFLRGRVIRQPTTTAYMYDFRDKQGNSYQWLTYRAKPGLEVGKMYNIKATVKKHYNRRGERIILLARGKIL